jgi:XRE family transcriptional regulator, aerobic/anaerobic benzoate catabolism transcriptional regulator
MDLVNISDSTLGNRKIMSELIRQSNKESGGISKSPDREYLRKLGDRVRQTRARMGLSRKALAQASKVSERYLAQLESGKGNVSILLLRQIGRALQVSLEILVAEAADTSAEWMQAAEFLRRLSSAQLQEAKLGLLERFSGEDANTRRQRIALIGLRGAGKSTLGALLAERLDVPFLELDRLIEQENGLTLGAIFDLYGQAGFHRLERQCLDRTLDRYPRFVMATGGSIVSEQSTYEKLLGRCSTVWLRATPEDHMSRVIAQGDLRPMEANPQAMDDLRRILQSREPLYARAGATIETSGKSVAEAVQLLLSCV